MEEEIKLDSGDNKVNVDLLSNDKEFALNNIENEIDVNVGLLFNDKEFNFRIDKLKSLIDLSHDSLWEQAMLTESRKMSVDDHSKLLKEKESFQERKKYRV